MPKAAQTTPAPVPARARASARDSSRRAKAPPQSRLSLTTAKRGRRAVRTQRVSTAIARGEWVGTQRIAPSASVCIIALGFFGGSAAQAQTYYQSPPPYQAPPYYYSRDPDRREYGPRDYGPRDYSPPEYGAHGYDWGLPPYEIMRIVR